MLSKIVVSAFLAGCLLATFVPSMNSEEVLVIMEEENEGMNLQGVYRHCGRTRQCFGVPVGCIKTQDCQQLLSYGKEEHHRIPFDLYGVPPNATYRRNFWVGFGASNSGGMDNSSVVQCAHFANGKTEVRNAYNAINHSYVPLSLHHSGIHPEGALYRNGYVHCAFKMEVVRTVANETFDYRTPYYLLLGSGWVNHTKEGYELKWHLELPKVFNQTVFACGPHCKNETGSPLPVRPTPAIDPFFPFHPTEDEEDLEVDFGDVYSECGKRKRCFGFPDGCLGNKTCGSVLAYGVARENRVPIELYGTAPNSTYADNFWIGFGASISGGMDQSAVVQCAHYSNGTNDVLGAYNALNHSYQSIPDRYQGITHRRHRFANGYLHCSFHLNVNRNVSGTVFDLSTPYTLLVGNGWINQTGNNTYELKWHLDIPYRSPQKVVMTCGNNCSASTIETEFSDAYTHCGKAKRCFGFPDGCLNNKTCTSLLKYGEAREARLPIELFGTAPNSSYSNNFWIGFAASASGKMDRSAVVQCAHYSNGTNEILGAYNGLNHSYMSIPEPHQGITKRRAEFKNGFLRCYFHLDLVRNVSGMLFNLSNPYNLLVGNGWINETSANKYDLKWHIDLPIITPKVAMSCGNKCPTLHFETEKAETTSVPPNDCNGDTKCYGRPEGCVASGSCTHMLKVKDMGEGPLRVVLTGAPFDPAVANNFWIGFGSSKSGGMDDSAVVQCAYYGNGKADVIAAYNSPTSGYQPLAERHLGISDISGEIRSGVVTCSFLLDVVRNINSEIFDLTQPYNLLLARGPINLTSNALLQHMERWNSTDKIAMAQRAPASIYQECGISRKCIGVPAMCVESKNCEQVISYGDSNNSDRIPVEIYGRNVNSSDAFWVGLGLSMSGKMVNSAVIMCATTNASMIPQVVTGFNWNGDENDGHAFKTVPQDGIHDVSSNAVNGFIWCSFGLSLNRTVENITFDLSMPYTPLLATGPMRDNNTRPGYHGKGNRFTFPRTTFACGNRCPPSPCTNATCFGVPVGCEDDGGCQALLAWSAVPNQNNTQEGGVIQVGIYGQAPVNVSKTAYWIGFGVSHGRQMEHTAVVQCVIRPDGNNTVIAAYNYDRDLNAGYTPFNDTRGIHQALVNSTDGALSCTFQLDVIRRYQDDNETFDLREYTYVILGSGPLAADNETPTKHSKTPRISDYQFAMACDGNNCTTQTTTTIAPTSPTSTGKPANSGRFGYPQGCENRENSCKVLAKYGLSAANSSRVSIVLEGRPDAGEENGFWTALGVNTKAQMENAMVFECVSWNDGTSTKQEVFTSVNLPNYVNQRTSLNGVYVGRTSMTNGVIQCLFDVDVIRTAEVTNTTYDLNTPYYLLLAEGKTRTNSSEKNKHDNKVASSQRIVVAAGGNASPASDAMKKAHACLMVIAWNLCAAMGIFFARHTKNMWPEQNYFGTKTWFNLHRGHNFLAVILAAVAFVLIFVDKARWLDIPHAYTGVITFALAFIQPIIATFRPHPGTPNRPIFNYVHWSIGYVALLLAGVTMFLGFDMRVLGVPGWVGYLIVGSYVWNILLQMILENYKYRHQERIRRESKERLVTENGQVVEKTVVERTVTVTDADEPLAPEDNVRKLIMGLIYLGLLVDTIAVVILIAIY